MRSVTRSRRRALGLTEVLLGTLLLALLVIPLMELVEKLLRQTRLTKLRVVARSLARNVVERYRLEPLDLLRLELAGGRDELALGSDPLLAVPVGPLAALVAAHRMRRTIALTAAGTGLTAGRKAVLEARVTWIEDGREFAFQHRALVVDARFPTGAFDDGAAGPGGAP